jgi:signal transduction histidine kinase
VVEAQELERARLARELHDETGQALASILLGLKPLERTAESDEAREAVASLRTLVVSTLQSVRRLAVELRPSALDDFGLVAAVERLAETFGEQSGVTVDLETQLGDERVSKEAETALYRVIQEALSNVVKHSGATRVSILLQRKGDAVMAVVEDDGSGFDPSTTRADALGISGMRERASLAGGRLQVESRPGSGTTLVAEVPSG